MSLLSLADELGVASGEGGIIKMPPGAERRASAARAITDAAMIYTSAKAIGITGITNAAIDGYLENKAEQEIQGEMEGIVADLTTGATAIFPDADARSIYCIGLKDEMVSYTQGQLDSVPDGDYSAEIKRSLQSQLDEIKAMTDDDCDDVVASRNEGVHRVKITRSQLRKILREQYDFMGRERASHRVELPEGSKLPLTDTGPGMKRELAIEIKRTIKKWRDITRSYDLSQESRDHMTFNQYVDEAFDVVRDQIWKSPPDYSVPYDLPGLREMRITRRQLRRIIRESIIDEAGGYRKYSPGEIEYTSRSGTLFEKEPYKGDELDYAGQDLPDPYAAADISGVDAGRGTFLSWANKVRRKAKLADIEQIGPIDLDPSVDEAEGWLHAYDAWSGGMSPEAYASRMTILPLVTV
jgi:hypothetical protein